MPAYLIDLPRCDIVTCGKPATQKLMNGRNAPVGFFCDRHALRALDAFRAHTGEVDHDISGRLKVAW